MDASDAGYVPVNERVSVAPPRQLTAARLALYALAYTIGAPIGMSPVLRDGGPTVALVGLVAATLLYAVPQALVASELSSMMPTPAGALVWVTRAFGVGTGFYYAWIQLLQFVGDISAACALVAHQLRWLGLGGDHQSPAEQYFQDVGVRLLVLMLGAAVAVLSLSQLSKAVAPLMVLIAIAVAAGFALSTRDFHSGMFDSAPMRGEGTPIVWTPVITTLIWLYAGITSVATAGGETTTPRTMLVGLSITCAAMLALYVASLLVMLAEFRSKEDLSRHAFLLTAFARTTDVLGRPFAVLVVVTTAANVTTAIASNGRFVWAIAEMGWAPAVLTRQRERNGAPYAAVVGLVLLCAPFALMSFTNVLAVLYTAAMPAIALGPLALLRLRVMLPELHRPVAVPCSLVGVWVVVLALLVVTGGAFVVSCQQQWWIALAVLAVHGTVLAVRFGASRWVFAWLRHEAALVREGEARGEHSEARDLAGVGLVSTRELLHPKRDDDDQPTYVVPTIAGVPVASVLARAGVLGRASSGY